MIEQTKDKIIIDKWGEDVYFLDVVKTIIQFYQNNKGNHLDTCEVDVVQSDDKDRCLDNRAAYRQNSLSINMAYNDIKHKLQDNV